MFVILVLLTAYFQSPRLALISIGAVPGVLAGIVTILYFTNTTLNIESFMGSIMCLGVSVSNSVMMVTFMDEHWKAGKPSTEAALLGASERLRPILMTACAMTVGMVPMALALERGSQMEAPLGRAVIGGLVMSTFATLLVLPSIFALVIGRQGAPLALALPGQPRKRALRPGARRRRPKASDHEDGRGRERRAEDRGHRRRGPSRRIGSISAARPARPVSPATGDERCKPRLGLTSGFARLVAAGSGSGSWPPSRRRAAPRRRRSPRASRSRRSFT